MEDVYTILCRLLGEPLTSEMKEVYFIFGLCIIFLVFRIGLKLITCVFGIHDL